MTQLLPLSEYERVSQHIRISDERSSRAELSGHEEIAAGAEVAAVSPYRENVETKKPRVRGFSLYRGGRTRTCNPRYWRSERDGRSG
jgi:hypothetical protein